MATATIDKTTETNDIHTYENLKEKTAGLTQDTLGLLIDIAAFFKENSSRIWTITKNPSGLSITAAVNMGETTTDTTSEQTVSTAAEPKKKRKFGFMADKFVAIAPDFDTCCRIYG